jgi:hypothetical protein
MNTPERPAVFVGAPPGQMLVYRFRNPVIANALHALTLLIARQLSRRGFGRTTLQCKICRAAGDIAGQGTD